VGGGEGAVTCGAMLPGVLVVSPVAMLP